MAESEPTIFVVDDDEAARDSLKALLESAGFRVETFSSGEAFLGAADPGARGCLILDLHMPGLDGLQVQASLAKYGLALPTLIVTGCGDKAACGRALAAGAIAFLEKPVRGDLLLSTLGAALGSSSRAAARL